MHTIVPQPRDMQTFKNSQEELTQQNSTKKGQEGICMLFEGADLFLCNFFA